MSELKDITNTLTAMIGHQSPIEVLTQLIKINRLPHALLFSGPAGVGKWTLARNFAASILALNRNLNQAELNAMRQAQHPDLHLACHELGTKDISVDRIRELRSALQLSSYYGGYKIAIIDDAHKMSLPAANALLKTLEEPAEKTILILVSDCVNRIPQTIVSRCQTVHFSLLPQQELQNVLEKIASEIAMDFKYLPALQILCGGSLENLSLRQYLAANTKTWINADDAKQHIEMLVQNYKKIKENLARLGSQDAVSLASSLLAEKEQRDMNLTIIFAVLREQLKTASSGKARKLADAVIEFSEVKRLITERNANPETQLSSFLLSL